MFFFNFEDDDREKQIAHIKDISRRIALLNFKTGIVLKENEKQLSSDIGLASFNMFSKIKLTNKSFTVCDNTYLKKIEIEEDTEGIPEKYITEINDFFEGNVEAFQELVAQYISKRKQKVKNLDFHLFYINIISRYSAKEEEIFFVQKGNTYYVFIDEIRPIKLNDYVNDYFIKINDTMKNRLDDIALKENVTHEEQQNLFDLFIEDLSTIAANENSFLEGAISFFDFLGWKGLWLSDNKNPLKEVSNLMEKFQDKLIKETVKLFPDANGIAMSKLLSISDTIAIFTPKVAAISKCDLLEFHARIAKFIIEESVIALYPIRGAITYGEYNITNNIMRGPGIDECASWHETCDWIGAHFSPNAQFLIEENCNNLSGDIIKNKVPLKSGLPSLDYCVKWYVDLNCFRKLINSVKALLPEIASKYMNTYNFLYTTRKEEDQYGQNGIGQF